MLHWIWKYTMTRGKMHPKRYLGLAVYIEITVDTICRYNFVFMCVFVHQKTYIINGNGFTVSVNIHIMENIT